MASQKESLLPQDLDLPPTCSSPLSDILDRKIQHPGFGPHPSRDILSAFLVLQFLPPGMTFLIPLLAYTYVFQNSAFNDPPAEPLQDPLFFQGMTPLFLIPSA